MFFITFSTGIYYTMLLAWTMFYFVKSIIVAVTGATVPWAKCEQPWATERKNMMLVDANICRDVSSLFAVNHAQAVNH